MPGAVALGWGAELPARIVDDAALAAEMGVDPSALAAAGSVGTRRRAEPGLGASGVARPAAERALAAAGLGPDAVDLIVFATMSPDIAFPGPGCFLQSTLGCRTVGALDIRAQCAGFVAGLAVADAFIRAGRSARVLVCGAEVHSSALDYSPRAVAVTPRFGDGAGAVLLGPGEPGAVLAAVVHNDPDGLERFWCEFPASRHFPTRMPRAAYEAGRHYYAFDAPALAEQARASMVAVTREALAQAGVAADALALSVMHYVDPALAREAGAAAGLSDARTIAPAEQMAHVSAGGIPIAIAEALAAGRVGRGDLVCCTAFGAGIAWGSAVLRL